MKNLDPEDEAFEELSLKQGQWQYASGWRKKQILKTSMTQEALKKMYQLLLTEPHAPTVCAQLERIAREALADHAMQEVQRLGQEIEQEPVAYYLPHKGFYWAKPTSISAPTIADVEPLPLYTHPPKETK